MNYSDFTDKEVASELESARLRLEGAKKDVRELENERDKRDAKDAMASLGFKQHVHPTAQTG